MRKLLIIFTILLMCFSTAYGAMTYSPAANKPNRNWWTGHITKDIGWLWAKETEALVNATAGTATASKALILNSSSQVDVLKLTGSLQILEGGGTPTKYTIFQGGNQSADLTLTFPTGYAAVTGYVLTSTDAGVLSWAAGTGTFTGGAISSDCTLANGVDLMSSTTTAQSATIKVYDLTAAAAGLEYTFVVMAAQELRVTPVGNDLININGIAADAAEYWTANAAGEALHLVAVDAVNWIAVEYTGTWTQATP